MDIIFWSLTVKNNQHDNINSMEYLKSIKNIIVEKFISQDTLNNFPNIFKDLLNDNALNINDIPYIKPGCQALFIFMKNNAGFPESIYVFELVTTHKHCNLAYMPNRVIF